MENGSLLSNATIPETTHCVKFGNKCPETQATTKNPGFSGKPQTWRHSGSV